MSISPGHYPIDSTQQLSPHAVLPPTPPGRTESIPEDIVNNCLTAFKAAQSTQTKTQAINDIRRAISNQKGIDIEWVKQVVSRLHSLLEKEAALTGHPETKNQTSKEDRRIETQNYEHEVVKAIAEQLFANNPTEIYQMVLEHKFPPALQLELIFIITKNNSKWVTNNIAALKVEQESDRVALAKIAVQAFVPSTASTALMTRIEIPKKYNISDEASVVEIVKLFVQSWVGYMRYIDRLKIKDQKLLTDLINYAITCNPYGIFLVPKNLITDKQCMADIFLTCVKKATYPAQVFSWIEFPEELQSLKTAFQMIMGPEKHIFDNTSYLHSC